MRTGEVEGESESESVIACSPRARAHATDVRFAEKRAAATAHDFLAFIGRSDEFDPSV
jgi:hypothetical protein